MKSVPRHDTNMDRLREPNEVPGVFLRSTNQKGSSCLTLPIGTRKNSPTMVHQTRTFHKICEMHKCFDTPNHDVAPQLQHNATGQGYIMRPVEFGGVFLGSRTGKGLLAFGSWQLPQTHVK